MRKLRIYMWVCAGQTKEGKKQATFDILETINYMQLTSQTALFKSHQRILLGGCLHTEATGLQVQEAAHSLNAPFSAFLTGHFELHPLWPGQYSRPSTCFPSAFPLWQLHTVCCLLLYSTCYSFPPSPCIYTEVIVCDGKKNIWRKHSLLLPHCRDLLNVQFNSESSNLFFSPVDPSSSANGSQLMRWQSNMSKHTAEMCGQMKWMQTLQLQSAADPL